MHQDEDYCIWSLAGKYFGLPVGAVARVGRAPIRSRDVGASIDGALFGDFLPAGTKVRVPDYGSPDPAYIQDFGDKGNFQYILVNNGSEFLVFIAERVIFVGTAASFEEQQGSFENLAVQKYFPHPDKIFTYHAESDVEVSTSAEAGTEVLCFKIEYSVFSVPLSDVVRLFSPKDLHQFKLLCDRAAGYIFDGPATVPVVKLSHPADESSSRILTYRQGDSVLGVIVDEMLGIKVAAESQAEPLNLETVLGSELTSKLGPAYEKVFPSPRKKLEQANGSSTAMSVIKVDIGEVVFVATEMVLSVQLCQDIDLNEANTFVHNESEMPLIYLPRYYGFKASTDPEKKNQRILIVENNGIKMALAVEAVLEIIQVDRNSERQILNWSLNNYSANFRSDATGIINVADYRSNGFLNVIYLNFTTLFQNQQVA